jgi:diguanylate cyclase (GGDEF)-like protein/PAS domain S-box-containing protein
MADRTELLESALDSMRDGIALFDVEDEVAFWNQAAETVTGYPAAEVIGSAAPHGLEPLAAETAQLKHLSDAGRGALINVRHKLGRDMQLIARVQVLRDGLGEQIGTAITFHPAESLDPLSHSTPATLSEVAFEEHLRSELEDCEAAGLPCGIYWIKVDQAEGLRKTHGTGACDAMLAKLEHALAAGLRPAEVLGRWGEDEFLIISHERTQEMFAAHARMLAGLARTADFKWWGDRVSITVSIGAVQALQPGNENLVHMLERARHAMETSARSGGNCVTLAQRDHECLRS